MVVLSAELRGYLDSAADAEGDGAPGRPAIDLHGVSSAVAVTWLRVLAGSGLAFA